MNISFNPISMSYASAPKATSFKGNFNHLGWVYDDEYVGNNSYVIWQDTPYINPLNKGTLETFKSIGMKNVVNLLNKGNNCEVDGIKYLSINMNSDDFGPGQKPYLLRPPFVSKDEYKFDEKSSRHKLSDKEIDAKYDEMSRDYVDKFVQLIQMMQEGNTIICGYIKSDSDYMLNMNKYFNPQASKTANDKSRLPDMMQIHAYRNLYNNLTDEDKKAMNWTKEFDENFMARLDKDEALNDNYVPGYLFIY